MEAVLPSWMPDRAWWAQKVVAFAVDGASNLGARPATAQQAVDVSAMEHNVFAMLLKWLSLLTPLGEPCHVVQRKLGDLPWRLAAKCMVTTWQLWVANVHCTTVRASGRTS